MNPLAQTRRSEPLSTGDGDSTTRIGRFELLEEIGQGSMGIVYLARDPMIGRWVAVKKLTGIKGKLLEPDVVRRLLINEARSVGALEHPGIVTVFDVVEDEDGKVEALAMEYVAGKSLRDRLNEPDPLSLNYVNEVISSVAEVLDHAHDNGCIHRDVKPANVLLAHDGTIKVADFGIAALRGEDLASELRNLGTPNYLAPERVMGQPGDQHTDIYSLGVILYELLTRHLPFEASSIAELVQKIVQEAPTPPERYVPGLMTGLRDILDRALAKEPGERYSRAGDLARDLREIVEAQASMNDTVPAPMTSRRSVRKPPREAATPAAVLETPFQSQAAPAKPEAVEDAAPVEVVEWETTDPMETTDPELLELPDIPDIADLAAPDQASSEPMAGRVSVDAARRAAVRLAGWLRTARSTVLPVLSTALSAARTVGSGALGSSRPLRRIFGNRFALAALVVFAFALPVFLLILAGEAGAPSGDLTVDVQSTDRFRYLALLDQSHRLREGGSTERAVEILRRANGLFPETRGEVRQEALVEVAVAREFERLDRVEELTEQAHLQIARTNLAGAEKSIRELTEIDAPQEALDLLASSVAQSRQRLRMARLSRETKVETAAVAEPPAPVPVARPAVVRRPPPKTGPGSLLVEFSSARSRGVLTVYSSERQILSRPYRFVEKKNFLVRKGVSGSFSETVELPEGGHDLKIYLSQPKQETQLEPLTVTIPPGDTKTLRLRVQADGRLVVGSR